MNIQSVRKTKVDYKGSTTSYMLLCGLLIFLYCSRSVAASASVEPSYAFVGKGFHMELEVIFPQEYSFYNVSVTLPSDFFFDVAECEQQYRLLSVSPHYKVGSRESASPTPRDVSHAFSNVEVSTNFFFDIEAPVFKVNYTENTAVFLFNRQGKRMDAVIAEKFNGLLVLPIHARYEPVDPSTPFSLFALALGEKVNVTRCITKVSVQAGHTQKKWTHVERTLNSGAVESGHCSVIPVGVLQDISIVYFFLMSLLVFGTLIVGLCV